LGASAFFLLLHLYFVLQDLLAPWLSLPGLGQGVTISVIALMMFSLCHASYSVGIVLSGSFFGISAVISWAFEQVGVATGAIYGAYHYPDKLGLRLGHVPLVIPLTWFAMGYPSHVIANLISKGYPVAIESRKGWLFWLAFLGGAVMTGWDLPMDPMMSSAGNWIWEEGGAYFGVPVRNYFGWILTTSTIYLLYRLLESARGIRPVGEMTLSIALMPVLAYGGAMTLYVAQAKPEALRIIAAYSMGLPMLIATAQAVRTWLPDRARPRAGVTEEKG
jgi:putative membrane protein